MKKFRKFLAGAATLLCVGLTCAPGASAAPQPIQCATHALDATAAQGVDTDFIEKQIGVLQSVMPSADVYAHAYEHIPGGTPEEFWKIGQQQCNNWHESDGRIKDGLLVIVYGHDTDQYGLFYGYQVDLAVAKDYVAMMNSIMSNIGPERSQVNPNYVTQALIQPLIDTKFGAMISVYYDAKSGLYKPPPYMAPVSPENVSPREVAGMVVAVIASFAALGLVLLGLSYVVQRVRKKTS